MNGVTTQGTKRIAFLSVLCVVFLFLFSLFPVRVEAQAQICNVCNAAYENGFCVCEGGEGYQPAVKIENGENGYDGYYAISNAGQLYWFARQVETDNATYGEANAVLTCNIVVNTGDVAGCDGVKGDGRRDWSPVGVSAAKAYKGIFDGNGFTVGGLYLRETSRDHVGLIGYLSGGTVKNVYVENGYLYGRDHVGGVVGFNRGTVERCGNLGATLRGRFYAGGIAGYNNGGKITDCYNVAAVSGDSCVGGIVGGNQHNGAEQGSVCRCYNVGTVLGSDKAQGIAGRDQGDVDDCFYLAQAETDDGGKTAAQFASGEVAYLLGGAPTEEEASVWGQTLQGNGGQLAPVLGGKAVYYGFLSCVSGDKTYSNDELFLSRERAHVFADTQTANDTHHYYACAVSGCEAYKEIEPHVYGEERKRDGNGHWRECVCGHKTEYAAHAYGEWTEIKRATEKETGERQRSCACGQRLSESIPRLPRAGLSKGVVWAIVGGGCALVGSVAVVLLLKKKKRR